MTSAIHGSPRLRYRDGTAYRGEQAPSLEYDPAADGPARQEATLVFWDSRGVRLGEVSTVIARHGLLRVEVERQATGPTTCSFSLATPPPDVTLTYGTRVDVHLLGRSRPWWSGFLVQVPAAAGTAWPKKYKASGWSTQLGWVMVDETWAGRRVWDIVDDLARRWIEPRTGAVYSSSAIVRTGGSRYLVSDEMQVRKTTAAATLDQLAGLAGGWEWGVGPDRVFYFRPKSAALDEAAIWWIGRHVQDVEPETDDNKVRNRLWVQCGSAGTSGDNFLDLPLEDLESQRLHGIRETVVRAPSVYAPVDAYRWASTELARLRAPVDQITCKGVPVGETLLDCRGVARLWAADGSACWELPKEQVTYKVTSARTECDVELGELPMLLHRLLGILEARRYQAELVQAAKNRQTT